MSGFKQQMETGRIMAKMPQHRQKVERAMSDIAAMLAACATPYVSVSWGKDSIVLGHLTVSIKPSITLVHWSSNQEGHIANFAAVRDDFLARFGQHSQYREVADEGLMSGKLRDAGRLWSVDNGFDGVLMGLTAEESKARKYALGLGDQHNLYRYNTGMIRCCPLARWTVEDITAYVAANELKMLNLYERYGMQIRTSSRIKQHGHTRNGLAYCQRTAQEAITASWNLGD